MPPTGRPSSPTTKAAAQMRDAVRAFLTSSGMRPSELARRTGLSASTVGRTLDPARQARETDALLKLHKFAASPLAEGVDSAVSAIGRLAQGQGGYEAATAVRILRAVADLLERVNAGG